MEIEIKSRCADLNALRSRLQDLGAAPQDKLRQKDCYLTHPCRNFGVSDEALRIRDDGIRKMMHYKGPRISSGTKSREEIGIELIDDLAMVAVLERLGFKSEYVVRKTRETFILDDCEISLDSVDGLGDFVEIEYIGDGDNGEKSVTEMARRLNVEGNEMRSYLELLYFQDDDHV